MSAALVYATVIGRHSLKSFLLKLLALRRRTPPKQERKREGERERKGPLASPFLIRFLLFVCFYMRSNPLCWMLIALQKAQWNVSSNFFSSFFHRKYAPFSCAPFVCVVLGDCICVCFAFCYVYMRLNPMAEGRDGHLACVFSLVHTTHKHTLSRLFRFLLT